MLKLEKSQYLNSIFHLNYSRKEKNVMIQNCLLHKDLQIWMCIMMTMCTLMPIEPQVIWISFSIWNKKQI